MSQKRVHGTLGIFDIPGQRYGSFCSKIELDRIETYQLCFSCWNLSKKANYQLFDTHNRLVQTWDFSIGFFKSSLDLSLVPDFPLRYERRLMSRTFLINPEGEDRTFMKQQESSRSFELDDLSFTHRDYQSTNRTSALPAHPSEPTRQSSSPPSSSPLRTSANRSSAPKRLVHFPLSSPSKPDTFRS